MFRLIVVLGIFCAVSAAALEELRNKTNRVVNGKDANIADFPYQVSIEQFGEHLCGGSILNERWILTAAHCLSDQILRKEANTMQVRAGTSERENGGAVKDVQKLYNHPEYDPWTMKNDAGLVKLVGTLVYSAFIQPVQLLKTPIPSGTGVTLTGWGKTDESNEEHPKRLQVVELKFLTTGDCASEKYLYGDSISEPLVCADGNGSGSCQGDSGGPLVVSGSKEQCGIVSFGNECAEEGFPGAYTDVTNPDVISFIETHVRLNDDN